MADAFKLASQGIESPASSAFAITPHASDALSFITRAVYVGGAGNIAGRLVNSAADVTFVGVPAGALLPLRFEYIRVSGTTATNLVGIY